MDAEGIGSQAQMDRALLGEKCFLGEKVTKSAKISVSKVALSSGVEQPMRATEAVRMSSQPCICVQRSVRSCRKSENSVFLTRKITILAKNR